MTIIAPSRFEKIEDNGIPTRRFASAIEEIVRTVNTLTDNTDEYTTSNVTEDRAFDADSTNVAELADVLGTLIADLKTAGVIQ